ncbi:MAG: asparagine synthase, partial [Bacteroidetes bacterium]|nr:asparagine synthase [Bacteroidota bacterium]
PWFKWHYTPRDISFNQALEEFTTLFEQIVKEQTQDKKVILPLSGGLDSRTQAVALKRNNADVFAYSYQFENGYAETKIAKQIAKACQFEFKDYTIPKGYLWNEIDTLAKLNNCFSDFTAPRQMAIYSEYDSMGDVFSLGHWGDVLFDSFNLPELSEATQVDVLVNKLIKKGGLELATKLWQVWGLSGSFEDYFRERISKLLQGIEINDTNAKLRAFKSMYWAPRWTSVNLSIYSSKKPISLPYYDDRMCRFICRIPERFLKGRQLQIAYIKAKAPELAKITWQDKRPFNLNNFQFNKVPYNLPYRVKNKLQRISQNILGNPYVQRNWELQFVGKDNETKLKAHLFNEDQGNFVPKSLIKDYYDLFLKDDKVQHAHPINILLVLSKLNQMSKNE